MQEMLSPEIFLIVLPIVLIILKLVIKASSVRRKPLPPGPKPWPIIGNLLSMVGKTPHVTVTKFSEMYGPLISLRFGSVWHIIASSPDAAIQVLKTHDRILSARYVPQLHPLNRADCDRLALVWATKCTQHWKFLRRLCHAELFSAKAIQSQAALRERKVGELLEFLDTKQGKVVNLGEVVFTTVFNILGNLIFSKDFIGWKEECMASGMKGLVGKMMKLGVAPNMSDFYPVMGRLDLQGFRKESSKCYNDMFAAWQGIVRERRESKQGGDGSIRRDFLDVFLDKEFSDEQINHLALELFVAGADTSTGTIEWAMVELIKNRGSLERLREELNREISRGSVKEAHVSKLPYLNACVKETLRLHPPVPFLLPHRALETVEIMNCTVPKDSRLFVNVYAIGRDPNIWEDPLSFKPERFLGSDIEFKGQHFEFLPFGAGRRMCPGLPMADNQLHLILASLVHHFQWSLPHNEDPLKLDMSEKLGLTLQKEEPLLAIPRA